MGFAWIKLTSSLQKKHHFHPELMPSFQKYSNNLQVMTMRYCLFFTFYEINKVTNLANRFRAFELIQTLA
jgi:hypothetical protein